MKKKTSAWVSFYLKVVYNYWIPIGKGNKIEKNNEWREYKGLLDNGFQE